MRSWLSLLGDSKQPLTLDDSLLAPAQYFFQILLSHPLIVERNSSYKALARKSYSSTSKCSEVRTHSRARLRRRALTAGRCSDPSLGPWLATCPQRMVEEKTATPAPTSRALACCAHSSLWLQPEQPQGPGSEGCGTLGLATAEQWPYALCGCWRSCKPKIVFLKRQQVLAPPSSLVWPGPA